MSIVEYGRESRSSREYKSRREEAEAEAGDAEQKVEKEGLGRTVAGGTYTLSPWVCVSRGRKPGFAL